MTSKPEEARSEHELEMKEATERQAPGGSIIYEAIHKEGEEELDRSSSALAWSGLAAGLSMGFSLIGQGMLEQHLPDTEWRPLISSFGYSLGFLIVVLGRQQLFTENTLTVILPLLRRKSSAVLMNVLRLWTIVFLANVAGSLLFAAVITRTPVFDPETLDAFRHIGHEAMAHTFGVIVLRGIFAGWLIALMVWLLPYAETARVGVIIILTYFVGLAKLSHVIAGSVESLVVVFSGSASWTEYLGGFLLPALLGNIIGGVTLVAALNHAQVVGGMEQGDV